jgi:opacity protein-like surface antigen
MGRGSVGGVLALSLACLTAVCVLPTHSARAEAYIAAYAGEAFTQTGAVDAGSSVGPVFVPGGPLPPFFTARGLLSRIDSPSRYDNGFLFGGKAGYFLDKTWLGGNPGLEVEIYHYDSGLHEPDFAVYVGATGVGTFRIGTVSVPVDLETTAVAFNALYRWPLFESRKLPRGRVQLYGGPGLGIFVETLKTEPTLLGVPKQLKDRETATGLQLVGGLKIFVTPHVALFGEYKYIATGDFTFEDSDPVWGAGMPVRETMHLDHALHGNQVYGGVAIHF